MVFNVTSDSCSMLIEGLAVGALVGFLLGGASWFMPLI